MSYETAVYQWEDGARRLSDLDPALRPALERALERIVEGLRRRLGGPFTTAELAELYDRGTEWCLDLALMLTPDEVAPWDAQAVVDAAFARYVRGARDFAGGRRMEARS